MKNHEETERSFVSCRPFSKQQKPLKCSPLEELESANLRGETTLSTEIYEVRAGMLIQKL
jgi:hypothetical protein